MPTSFLTRLRLTIASGIGIAGTLIMLGTVVPPFSMLLFPASIGGTELAPLFLLLGMLVLGLAWRRAPAHRRWRQMGLWLGSIVLLLSLHTVVRIPSAVTDAEAVMNAAFGHAYALTYQRPTAVRTTPISTSEVFCGLSLPAVVIDTDVVLSTVAGEIRHADIFHPLGAGPHPVIIAIHGGAWSSGTRHEGATCHRALAASGFLVIAIDYRLAPQTHFPAQLDDVRAAIAWSKLHAVDYGADPSRMALLGRSAGAQLALLAAYAPDADIRAVVGFYSPVDLNEGYHHPSIPDPLDTRRVFTDYLGGTADEVPELYRAASPLTYATRPHPPTLLINGGRDHLIYLHFAHQLAARLHEHGTAVAVIDIPWSEHAFDAIPHGLGGQLALYHLERFLWAML